MAGGRGNGGRGGGSKGARKGPAGPAGSPHCHHRSWLTHCFRTNPLTQTLCNCLIWPSEQGRGGDVYFSLKGQKEIMGGGALWGELPQKMC